MNILTEWEPDRILKSEKRKQKTKVREGKQLKKYIRKGEVESITCKKDKYLIPNARKSSV